MTEKGTLVACSLDTGRPTWDLVLPSVETARFAMAAAPGMLLLAAGTQLLAYESAYRPAPGGVAWDSSAYDVEYTRRFVLSGVLGTGLRTPGAQVAFEFDEQPFGRWRRLMAGPAAPDGYFEGVVGNERNTRFRVRTGSAVSRPLTVYTYPRAYFRTRRGRGRAINDIAESVTLRFDEELRMGGRRLHLYIARVNGDRLDRIGGARLRSRGPGRASATVRYRALRRVGRRDFLVICVPRMWRLGLGRRDLVARRCGARRIRVRL